MTVMRADLLSQPGSAAPDRDHPAQRHGGAASGYGGSPVPRRGGRPSRAVGRAAQPGVAVQASGHGAGAPIESDRVLVDTSGLNTAHIDARARVAHVGAGATWSAVNAVAERDGLLGLAGSSPTVAVAGYTFGGGVGFLTRPYGMASGK